MADLAVSGTKTFVVGTASGLDTATLIEVAVQQKTQKADSIDIEIEENSATISSYQEFQTLSQDLQTALDAFIITDSFDTEDTSIFESRSGFLTSNDGTDVTTVLSVGIDDGVVAGEYEIEVLQEAKSHKVVSDTLDPDASLGFDGTFTLSIDGYTATDITVTSGQTLADIADSINAVSDDTGVIASVLQVSETESRLVLTGATTAETIQTSVVSGDDVLDGIGVLDTGAFKTEIQTAQGAIIEIDGVSVTRDTNNFEDVLDGIDIDIVGAAPGTLINLEITNDVSGTKEAIENFVTAYNSFRNFVVSQQTVSEDGDTSGALFSDSLLENLSFLVTEAVGSSYTDNDVIESLADIGITFTNNNLLVTDDAILDEALLDNYDEVASLFTTSSSFSDNQIALLSNDSTTQSFDFALDITVDGGGTITSASVGGVAFDINGTLLTGAEGTDYEGLSFSYQGATTTSIDVIISQGLGDILNKTLDSYSNDVDGLIQQEIFSLQDQNEDLTDEAADIRANAETFRQSEIERYAAFEAAIQAAELALQQIRAILGNDDDD